MLSASVHTGARVIARAALAVVLAILLPFPGWSAEDADALERRALQLVYDGRCSEALPEIASARRQRDSARLAMVDGQCRLRLRDFAGALGALDEAKRLDPDLEDVDAYRGVALYQLEEYGEARGALSAARGRTSRVAEPQLALYTGMLLLRDGRERDAAEALDRARLLDPGQVEPVASFYAGLAWQAAGERDLARESLLRVQAADPDGSWGQRAEELLAGQGFDERFWGSILAGLEYDSNVVLLGQNVPSPLGISDEADGRGMWFLEGAAQLFDKGAFSGGLNVNYAGNAQFELRQFDIQYPRAGAWLDYEIDPRTSVVLTYGFGYAWVDYSPFVLTQDASLNAFRNWGRWGNTEVGIGWIRNDYKFFILPVPQAATNVTPGAPCANGIPNLPCAPAGLDAQAARNRDGNSLRPFFLHRYKVRSIDWAHFRDVELRGGYGFERYWAEGTDWDYQSHDFLVGAKVRLFWNILLDSELGFSYRPYTYPSSYPVPPSTNGFVFDLNPNPREDKITTLYGVLEKPIDDHWSVLTSYTYWRSDSNVVVFDYTRHIVGAYAKYTF